MGLEGALKGESWEMGGGICATLSKLKDGGSKSGVDPTVSSVQCSSSSSSLFGEGPLRRKDGTDVFASTREGRREGRGGLIGSLVRGAVV